MTADFEQTTKANTKTVAQKKGLSAQHMNQTFKGSMKVERPGKFYWETVSPSKQTIVTSGKTVWIYDPDLQQAVRQSLDDQVADTPALLLSGNTNQIMKSYRVTQPDKSKLYFTLFPKKEDGALKNNLLGKEDNAEIQKGIKDLKAFMQDYMDRIINHKLSLK